MLYKRGNLEVKSKLTNCSACGEVIAKGSKVTCPHCGKVNKKPIYKRIWFIVLIVFVLLGAIGSLLGRDDTDNNQNLVDNSNENTSNVDNESKTNDVEAVVREENKSNETVSQSNAVDKAKSYLSFTAFSRDGLIKQLEFEGFSNEDAVYGADTVGANWMEQALKSAKNYLDFSAFSRKGLINQLEFEGYTNEEAIYGVDGVGADWMLQAELKAKNYLEYSSFSRQGLIDQLEFEGFTSEEAVHGVDTTGL